MEKASHVLATLGSWCASQRAINVPEDVRRIATHAIIDVVGVAFAGSATTVARAALAVALDESSAGPATVLSAAACARDGLKPLHAAAVNATAGHALDFDDNSYAGFVHGSVVIAPAALAAAQMLAGSGRDLLKAFIVGSEVQYALGTAMGQKLYDAGWWTTGVYGPIGSCAATCHLLGLSAEATTAALGLALCGTGGTKAGFGTDAKALMAGQAAFQGMRAALLASKGCTGPANAVEHQTGFAQLFNDGLVDARALDALGNTWFLQSPGLDLKRIPVCLSSHAAVDAVLELASVEGFVAADIEHISCDVPEVVVRNLRHARPTTGQEAQFSMQFAVTAALQFGAVTLETLAQECIVNEDVRTLMARIDMVTSERWHDRTLLASAPEGAFVKVRLRDGREFTHLKRKARGSADEPLSATEVTQKFLSCAQRALTPAGAERLVTRLHQLDGLSDTRDLFQHIERKENQG